MKLNARVPVLREAVQKIVPMLSDRAVRVTMQGAQAYVEYDPKTKLPKRVNIPYLPEDAGDEFLDAIQGFLDHEVGHILFTNPETLVEARKKGVASMHNIIEDPFVEKSMARRFSGSGFNLANTGRFFLREITMKMLAEHPDKATAILVVPAVRAWAGQQVFIDFMRDGDHWAKITDFVKAAGPDMPDMIARCESSHDCLNAAVELHKRLKKADEERKKEEEKKEEKEEKDEGDGEGEGEAPSPKEKSKPKKGKGKSKPEPEEAPEPADEGGEPEESPEPEEGKEDEAGDGDEDDGTISAETEGDDAEGSDGEGDLRESADTGEERPERELSDAGKGETAEDGPKGAPGHDEVPDSIPEFGPGEKEEGSEGAEDAPTFDLEAFEEDLEGSGGYDDKLGEALTKAAGEELKDSDYLIFSTDEDVIEPVGLTRASEGEAVRALQDRVDHLVGPMQKDLERAMAALSAAIWTPGHRSGRLHGAALVRGMFGRDDLFRRKEINRSKDVAVELVVDCSGSMSGSQIRIACESAYALSSVLERIGIKNEVIGFTTRRFSHAIHKAMLDESAALGETRPRYARGEALYMPIFKGFGERVTPEVRRRFVEVMGEGSVDLRENVDGECIRIAAQRLLGRREQRKVMIVLSDGSPCCSGDMRKLDQHLKAVVKEVQRNKIDVVGIGIEDSSVSRYYPKYVVLRNVSELPTEVMRQLKKHLIVA